MRFLWDEAKRESNLRKHGLDFADVYRVFDGIIVRQPDTRFHYDEHRHIGVGMLDALVVIVVHVEANETIRIILMRRAVVANYWK